MVAERTEVAIEDRWNVEELYADLQAWESAFQKAAAPGKPRWPSFQTYKGRLADPNASLELLQLTLEHDREISRLYTYAHLRHDEDIANDDFKAAYIRAYTLLNDFSEETSWMEPELLSLTEEQLANLLAAPQLAPFRFHLEKIIRLKKHTLSADKEMILAQSGQALQSSYKAFNALNDADLKFGSIQDSQGEVHEISHALYGLYIRSQDRTLRSNAFKKMHGCYLAYENTLCELLSGQLQAHFFNTKARGYSSCVEAALYPKNIDTAVYTALIQAVNEEISPLHRYIALRKKMLGVEELHLYDMYVPLIADVDIKMPYKEAEELVIASVAPLGSEYQNLLRIGLKSERWVDRYENKNKRSGAYSSGSYDTMPYILLNYKELLRDVFTLAHEAGHSMHSLLTHKHQPYQYGNYPIFLAEVASTFNEELLMQLLLQRAQTRQERIFLLNEKIEDIRATLFRQTMFAEFELLVHELVEKGVPLTPKLLRQHYRELNAKYFGPEVVIDEEAEVEWARIPHFYYNFYVFQYATGISAALALADRVSSGAAQAQSDYLGFLKGGSSRYPIEMLKLAGVDMTTPLPVKAAISKFGKLVAALERELAVDGE